MSLDPTHIPDQPYDSDAVNRARNLLEAIPETIGPYRILERIGIGGMGEVYRAEQRTPIRREVALKLIKLGMDTKLVIARFEAERQALALMDHPHIAKVFDANADDTGRPYFVMEYVKGKPITEYADHQRLSIPERLELFEQVCQAVQHAHHKGVIHRDLKPSNVLVCTQDGKPFSKVIDFGVAKAIVQRLTEKTFFTEDGQFVGTPHYMSPEQAEGSIDIDTRTDVYSLGVLLYELLTGSTPFAGDELRKAAFDQLKRMVIEIDPPKPSTRLQSNVPRRSPSDSPPLNLPPLEPAEKHVSAELKLPMQSIGAHLTPLETLARHRSTEPKRLSILVRGELDWIVMKALEKDRKRRYETPSSLATDIRSHLTGGTVLAAPPSLWYRTQKFAGKYRYSLIATAFALLLLAFLGTTYGLRRARIAEATTRDSESEAVAARDEAMQERDAKNEALIAEAAQRDLVEIQLIEGILRPIGYGDEPNTAELRSFVDWSHIPDARLKLRILEVAFENPEVALRLARRADRAMQACVTLSPQRRLKALELLASRQRDRNDDPRVRIAACWLALELGLPDLPALEESITWLSDPIAKATTEFSEFTNLAIAQTASRRQPEENRRLGNTLIAVLEKSTDRDVSEAAWKSLTMLAPRLEPVHITRGWDTLIAILERSTEGLDQDTSRNCLAALAPRLEPAQIARGGDILISCLETSTDGRRYAAVNCLHVLAPRMEQVLATRCWNALITVLEKKQTDRDTFAIADQLLTALAPKLSAEQITRSWDAIIGVLERKIDRDALQAAACGLLALAPRLSPEQITRGGDALIAVLEKSTDEAGLYTALDGVEALAPRLSAEQITRCVDALIRVLEKSTDEDALYAALNGLEALAPRLSPAEFMRCWNAIIGVRENTTDEAVQQAAGNSLLALALMLSPDEISRALDTIFGLLEKPKEEYSRQMASAGLVALAPKLSPEQITRVVDSLIDILKKPKGEYSREVSSAGLVALAPKLSSEQVTHSWDVFIGVLEKSTGSGAQYEAGNGLVALAPKLSPEQITRGGDTLIEILEKSMDAYALEAAVKGLLALTPKLRPDQNTRCSNAIIDVLNRATERRSLQAAGKGLVALAPQLSPELRVQSAEAIVASLYRVGEGSVTEQLLALMPHLERPTQDRIAAETLTILLDYLAVLESYFVRNRMTLDDSYRPAVMAIADSRSLSVFLQHPACIGEPREWMLQRFEELVFHDGNRVFLNLPEEDGERRGNFENPPSAIPVAGANGHGGLTPNRSPAEPPPRRFHTVHDAAVWIQQNWPDFDLEATHPVTWRGEM